MKIGTHSAEFLTNDPALGFSSASLAQRRALCHSSARWTFATGKILLIATRSAREKRAAA
ncbi:MAG: hypothetical protein LBJ95_02310 [Oscillospiraceae bacterium]|nr:hypothetical protein [Oscillospiraceae bacterium]